MPIDVPLSVLVVDDSPTAAAQIGEELARGGYAPAVEVVATADGMAQALMQHRWDLVCTEYHLEQFSGFRALLTLRRARQDAPVIMVSGSLDEDKAIAALTMGISDYVPKSNLERLVPVVERAIRQVEDRRTRRAAEEALRQSEERYRELIENANDVIFSVDMAGNFTSLNRAGEQISGYDRDELTHMNMAQVLTPESLCRAQSMIQQKLRDNQPTIYELELIARDGHSVPIELSSRLIFQHGTPVGVQGIARDITERKRAAAALEESEARYRALFENASDIVYTHDLAGNFTSVNAATERIVGYTREEVLNMNIAGVVAPDHVDRARDMIGRKLAEGSATTYELESVTKGGQRVLLEVNSQLIYAQGVPIGVQGIARDITERHRVEEELRSREQKQAAIADLGQAALARTDLPAVFDNAVRCVTRTLGVDYCTVTELLPERDVLQSCAGFGWKSGLMGHAGVPTGAGSQAGFALLCGVPVLSADLEAENRFAVPKVLHEHGALSGMSVIIHGSGKPFGALSAFSCKRDAFSQTDVHFLQSVANVLAAAIARKRLEDERSRHVSELATRVLQAQEEERKRIARELHDETAQSLSMLLTNLDLLEPHIPLDNEPLRSGFTRVGALAKRTLDETRALSHDLRPTILDDAGLVAALQWIAVEHERAYGNFVRIDAETRHAERLPSEVEVALFRIAQEALTNSGKYARAKRVNVTLTFPGSTARLVVKDNGEGFDPDRISGPTRKGRLGLYGMRERAALLGGTVSVHSAPGKGTEVRVELPFAQNGDLPEGPL
jgi:PAS domain S-box-containing protein